MVIMNKKQNNTDLNKGNKLKNTGQIQELKRYKNRNPDVLNY